MIVRTPHRKTLPGDSIISQFRPKIIAVLLVLNILFCGCRSSCPNNAPDQPAASWDRTEIYFGLFSDAN